MILSTFRRAIFSAVAALSMSTPLLAHAELFPEGILGMHLGQTRVEALTALVNAGVTPDLEKAQCSENIPEKNKAVANRICKLTIEPGSTYQGLPVNKVSFLFQDEGIVLIGMDVGATALSYPALRSTYGNLLGEPKRETPDTQATWRETAPVEVGKKNTQLRLYADKQNALIVYSFDTVQ
jgi:hypothetical protein